MLVKNVLACLLTIMSLENKKITNQKDSFNILRYGSIDTDLTVLSTIISSSFHRN